MDNDCRKKNTCTSTSGATTDAPEYQCPHYEYPQFQLDELHGHEVPVPASTSGHYPGTCAQCRSMDYLYRDFIRYLSSRSQSVSNIHKTCDQNDYLPQHCSSVDEMKKSKTKSCCWDSAMRRILQQRASFHPTLRRRTPDFSAHHGQGHGVCCYLGQNSDTLLYHCPCQTARRPCVRPSHGPGHGHGHGHGHGGHVRGWSTCEPHYSDSEFYDRPASNTDIVDEFCQPNPNSTIEEKYPKEIVGKGMLVSTDKSTQTDEYKLEELKDAWSEDGCQDFPLQLGGQGDEEGAVMREDLQLQDKPHKPDAHKGRNGLTYFLPIV